MIDYWTAITIAVLLALTMDFAYRQYASRRICGIIENVPPFGLIEVSDSADAVSFRIAVPGGQSLSACLYSAVGPPIGIVIFCPEMNGSHHTALNYCQALPEAGISVLSFAFRGQADSDVIPDYIPNQWITDSEVADLDAVIEYTSNEESLSRLPLGLFGVSRGGSAALLAACRHSRVRSIVTDSGYSTRGLITHFIDRFSQHVVPGWFFCWLPDWHVQLVIRQALRLSERRRGQPYVHLERCVSRLTQPALLISGARDSYVTPEVTRRLAQLIRQPEHTWVVPKAKHNKARTGDTQEYDHRIVQHFLRTLTTDGTPASSPSGMEMV